ncbi:hypothetical protein SRABI26_02726 [Arthrobacter sp. Bi26]|uniref:hypothetical protein n=1 Tax=Arthrobacter sp. Bi26 TaxID=2822350 RepID=UPI001D65BC88|nr:hypothetical protein [Arthrobacter sp. Bi26]CAH0234062.1 hypothetical protein SRABI26_02726 [Arthrobacter sp. Bi26]
MARNKVTINAASVRKLLTSPAVTADLERRGRAVKAAMGGDGAMETDVTPGNAVDAPRSRVRVGYSSSMHPVHARRHEAKYGTLARALAAGGGR